MVILSKAHLICGHGRCWTRNTVCLLKNPPLKPKLCSIFGVCYGSVMVAQTVIPLSQSFWALVSTNRQFSPDKGSPVNLYATASVPVPDNTLITAGTWLGSWRRSWGWSLVCTWGSWGERRNKELQSKDSVQASLGFWTLLVFLLLLTSCIP